MITYDVIKTLMVNNCVHKEALCVDYIEYLKSFNFIRELNDKICGNFQDSLKEIVGDTFFRNLGFQIIKYFYTIDSTMNYARRISKQYIKALVVSEIQTSGKGRFNRTWLSPLGGLWFTLIWPILNRDLVNILSLAIGAAIAKSLDRFLHVKVGLKWPNDIIINGRKAGGILIENIFENKMMLSIIGVGINVNNPMRKCEISGLISLYEALAFKVPRNSLLKALIQEIISTLNLNKQSILSLWKKYNITLGKRLIIKTNNYMIEGIAEGISENGLIIRDIEGRHYNIGSGEIVFIEGIDYKPRRL